MVRTVQITGLAAGRTTALSLGGYLGNIKVAGITQVRILHTHSSALSMHALAAHSHAVSGHALAAHSHALSGHALAAHSHDMYGAIVSGVAFAQDKAVMIAAGALNLSDASGGVPSTSTESAGTPAAGIDGVSGGTPVEVIDGVSAGTIAGGGTEGKSLLTYTVDSNGRYVLAATHPATGHFINRFPGVAGPRVELGDAVVATDILEITALLQNESGGVF